MFSKAFRRLVARQAAIGAVTGVILSVAVELIVLGQSASERLPPAVHP